MENLMEDEDVAFFKLKNQRMTLQERKRENKKGEGRVELINL